MCNNGAPRTIAADVLVSLAVSVNPKAPLLEAVGLRGAEARRDGSSAGHRSRIGVHAGEEDGEGGNEGDLHDVELTCDVFGLSCREWFELSISQQRNEREFIRLLRPQVFTPETVPTAPYAPALIRAIPTGCGKKRKVPTTRPSSAIWILSLIWDL